MNETIVTAQVFPQIRDWFAERVSEPSTKAALTDLYSEKQWVDLLVSDEDLPLQAVSAAFDGALDVLPQGVDPRRARPAGMLPAEARGMVPEGLLEMVRGWFFLAARVDSRAELRRQIQADVRPADFSSVLVAVLVYGRELYMAGHQRHGGVFFDEPGQ